MEVVSTPVAEISFNEAERILNIKILDGAEMNLKNIKVHYKKINDLVGNKNYLALVDASNYYTIDNVAWKYSYSKKAVFNRKAIAHYNCSPANRLTTSVFKKNFKSALPLEFFDSREEAVKWLKSFSARCN